MRLSSSLSKSKRNFTTPEKKVVGFINDDSSFQVREPVSSRYVISKKSIQATPSTWYMESNRKHSQAKTLINLLSDSKVSIQQHIQPNPQTFSPVQQQKSQELSVIKYKSHGNPKQSFLQTEPQKIHTFNPNKKLVFDNLQKENPFQVTFQQKYNIDEIENRKRSKSNNKTKKGLSLVKNINDKIVNQDTNPQIVRSLSVKFIANTQPSAARRQDNSIRFSYCKYFFTKIYNKFVQKNQINKYQFSQILLQQKLIQNLVKDRHFVNKTWAEISAVAQWRFKEGFPMKIIFAFLISVLGYSQEQIQLFETQEALMKLNSFLNSQQAIKVFKYFRPRGKQLRLKVLSRPKRTNSYFRKIN